MNNRCENSMTCPPPYFTVHPEYIKTINSDELGRDGAADGLTYFDRLDAMFAFGPETARQTNSSKFQCRDKKYLD